MVLVSTTTVMLSPAAATQTRRPSGANAIHSGCCPTYTRPTSLRSGSAAVERIAAILARQQMLELAARRRVSRHHECRDGREILPGRLVCPDAVGKWLKAQRPGVSFVALHAVDTTRPFDEKHRFDPRAIEVEHRPAPASVAGCWATTCGLDQTHSAPMRSNNCILLN
jgi:hypothetical protein